MMKTRRVLYGLISFFVSLDFIGKAMAGLKVKDGDTINVSLSSTEVNRVFIRDGEIDKVWGTSKITIIPDKKKGEVYLRPSGTYRKASIFVRSDDGSVYTLHISFSPLKAKTIELIPYVRRAGSHSVKLRNQSYISQVKSLLKSMVKDEINDSYAYEEDDKVVKLWQETKVVLEKSYTGKILRGEVYRFTNVSKKDMTLTESELTGFGSRVKAVAISEHALSSGQSTRVFIVRGTRNG